MRSLTPLIERILRDSPKARDSDHEVIIQVLIAKGFNPTVEQMRLLRELNFESIRRSRQKIQNTWGKYPPSPAVARQRRLKGYIMQQNSPTASVERTEQLITHQPAVSWMKED